jgi:hypothetical protein
MANKAKRRARPHNLPQFREREAARRDAAWRAQHAKRMSEERIDSAGRAFLRLMLWSFFLAVVIAGSANSLGIPAPAWLVSQ